MAVQPNYDGPALVKIQSSISGGQLVDLGYTEDGVDVGLESFWLDVHGDQNGGSDGPPIDIQFLGEIARIRLVLTSWDTANADLLIKRMATLQSGSAPTTGTPGPAGTLMFTESNKIFRVLIKPTNVAGTSVRPLNFPNAIPREAIEVNKGVKHSKLILVLYAYKNSSGVLWNTTDS